MIRKIIPIPEGLTLGNMDRIEKLKELPQIKNIRRFLCLVDNNKVVLALQNRNWWLEKDNDNN